MSLSKRSGLRMSALLFRIYANAVLTNVGAAIFI